MTAGPVFAWRQLVAQKGHFCAALAGVAFAVTLMLGQIGIRDSLLFSAVRLYSHLRADIVMTSWQYQFEQGAAPFPRRRVAQALALDGVASCAPLEMGILPIENPETHQQRAIAILGLDPDSEIFDFSAQKTDFRRLRQPGSLIYDAFSRPMYGPVAEMFRARGELDIIAARKQMKVVGLLELGPGYASHGYVFSSDTTYAALGTAAPLPSLGVIRLKPGFDAREVLMNLRAALPPDVRFASIAEFLEQEKAYWLTNAPIGFVFTGGLLLGIVVGSVVVYQILYSDVSNHLAEYATMKAMGYPQRALFRVVLLQAIFMSVLGFIPGALMADLLFIAARNATQLPIEVSAARLAEVYGLTLLMCSASAALSMQVLRKADPAEIF